MKLFYLVTFILANFLSAQNNTNEIRVGDLVHVSMKEDLDVKYEGEVSAAGYITLPYYGPAKIVGLQQSEAQVMLKKELEKALYQKATVSVVVVKRAIGYVYVYGAVGGNSGINPLKANGPGKVEIPSEKGTISTLQAIAEVGGLSKWADPKSAYLLIRNTKDNTYSRIETSLEEAYQNISGSKNIILKADDIVVVPSLASGKVSPGSVQVMVTGKVEKPGVVLFEPGEQATVIRAILKAGNFNKFADKTQVRLISKTGGSTEMKKINVEALLKDGKLTNDLILKSGDLIVIDENWF